MSAHTPSTVRADSGMAVVGALLVMILMAGIAAGLMALVVTDARVRSLDGTRVQAFYTAHAGLEKLTSDLGDLFSGNVAPTGAQITNLGTLEPNLPGVSWLEPAILDAGGLRGLMGKAPMRTAIPSRRSRPSCPARSRGSSDSPRRTKCA